VVLLDMVLPGVTGVSVAKELARRAPRTRVLMLSGFVDEAQVARAFAAGAIGFAIKDQPATEILQALREVAVGRTYMSPRLHRDLVEDHLKRPERADGSPLGPLSSREREVFDLLVRGFSNDAISGQLCISVKTVETHRSRVMKKLHLHSISELIRFAARNSLLHD
jgi:DNA-binding NarL/FixJ family response regulator